MHVLVYLGRTRNLGCTFSAHVPDASKLKAFLSTAEKSVDVHIYQITDESWFLFCGMKTASLFF